MKWIFIILAFFLYIILTTSLNMMTYKRRKIDNRIDEKTYYKLSLGINTLSITILILYYIYSK
ncbi:hypothetical protein [Macrococcus animalis]|uniref:hypothetical protein n=1 Tax=Macrococcus animalis TaxID=3395467 RepID=UPI0039BDACC9